jgi:hypothetical protein
LPKMSYTIYDYPVNSPIIDRMSKLLSEYEIAKKDSEDAERRLKLAVETMRSILTDFDQPPQEQAPDSAGPDLTPAEDRWVKRHFPPAAPQGPRPSTSE